MQSHNIVKNDRDSTEDPTYIAFIQHSDGIGNRMYCAHKAVRYKFSPRRLPLVVVPLRPVYTSSSLMVLGRKEGTQSFSTT
ncbi:hypothetical protein L5515_001307 [Caenorhabditis briggsae]|uniref:Uncharacterized protein n=1 Tax=Caenorhabditis briggsae TaxID=6238 RepID=A0AAE9J364_CAEBR|nr:hypothetical protein L3Y34_015232 [Caenorhabditis briggsae]UMM12625.1 hypothetical protein L5515_001307 [Caenorhabditis briggsae]